MTELGETAYASFVAMHSDRLVRSLVAETGLPADAAAAVAADVLPTAYERGFASCGAAYGWLRVAARHRAAGSTRWAAAADTALDQADCALPVLAALPAEDRELLRLRYVEGLLPAVLADRLGIAITDVLARLDRAQAAATASRPLPAPRRALTVPLPRAAAALVAAAAAVVVAIGGGTPPSAAPVATSPWPSFGEPLAPAGRAAEAPDRAVPAERRAIAFGAGARGTAVTGPVRHADVTEPEDGGCVANCGNGRLVDELRIAVPDEVGEATGHNEVSVKQEVAEEVIRLCDAMEPVPSDFAECVRGQA